MASALKRRKREKMAERRGRLCQCSRVFTSRATSRHSGRNTARTWAVLWQLWALPLVFIGFVFRSFFYCPVLLLGLVSSTSCPRARRSFLNISKSASIAVESFGVSSFFLSCLDISNITHIKSKRIDARARVSKRLRLFLCSSLVLGL